jgi:hypothetical protein
MKYLIVFLFLLNGCATVPVQMAPIVDSKTFDVPFDKVWPLIVTAISDKGYPIQAIEKQSGILTTKSIEVKSESFTRNIPVIIGEIGYKPSSMCFGAWNEAHYNLTIHATESSGNTIVKVKAFIEGVDGCDVRHDIPSRGKLEGELLAAISTKI